MPLPFSGADVCVGVFIIALILYGIGYVISKIFDGEGDK